jgi:predicted GNAT family acetyltransferase
MWEVDGTPVCDVGHGPVVGGQVRIGPVYTPREHRGHGYASNLTAHVTAELLAAGLVPTLFADLANSTSTGIYQALGYRAVADAAMLRFVSAA